MASLEVLVAAGVLAMPLLFTQRGRRLCDKIGAYCAFGKDEK